MDKLDEVLNNNKQNEERKKQSLGDPIETAPPVNVIPIKKRSIGEIINIDRVLYKVRKITRKDIILRQLTQEEVTKFNYEFDKQRRQKWAEMWKEKIENNPKTTYKNPEDKSEQGKHWYCKKHFIEHYTFEPRMYIDAYNLQDKCAKCNEIGGIVPTIKEKDNVVPINKKSN